VQIFLEEIHPVQTGHSLVVAAAVEMLVVPLLVVVHIMVLLEYQEDHFMGEVMVVEIPFHQMNLAQLAKLIPAVVAVVVAMVPTP
tara:strand:- start:92 stop:346 length:255 start_codon:yes stop_codon:yes gene_type:complete